MDRQPEFNAAQLQQSSSQTSMQTTACGQQGWWHKGKAIGIGQSLDDRRAIRLVQGIAAQ